MVDERTLGSYDLEDAVIASWNPKTPWFLNKQEQLKRFQVYMKKYIYIIYLLLLFYMYVYAGKYVSCYSYVIYSLSTLYICS